MNHEIGGWLWAFVDVILVLCLGGAMVYATFMWRRWKQHPQRVQERDQATRKALGGALTLRDPRGNPRLDASYRAHYTSGRLPRWMVRSGAGCPAPRLFEGFQSWPGVAS